MSAIINIGRTLSNFLSKAPASRNALPKLTPAAKQAGKIGLSAGTNVATTAGALSIFGTTALLTQTSGGQNLTSGALNLGGDVNRFFSANPLILLAIVGLGGLLVISSMGGKK